MEGGCWQSARGSSQTVMGRAGALYCSSPPAHPWLWLLCLLHTPTCAAMLDVCPAHFKCFYPGWIQPLWAAHHPLGGAWCATSCHRGSAQSTTSSEETDTDIHVCLQMRERRDKTVVQMMMAVCCSMLHRTTHSQTLCHGCNSLFLW